MNRAEILAGSRFDFKIEFPGLVDPAQLKVTINGADSARVLGKPAELIAREDGKDQSSLLLRDAALGKPGQYVVMASDGTNSRSATWIVYSTPSKRAAKNVILFIGDGFAIAHRTAARILSKGIAEGKYKGKLAMDDMPHMALVATPGIDSIITDSANSASAYTTGHKSCVNALGVYADRDAEHARRPEGRDDHRASPSAAGMAVGVVTNTEVEDATPAAMVAHTRRRRDYDDIVQHVLRQRRRRADGRRLGATSCRSRRPAPSARTRSTTSPASARRATRWRRPTERKCARPPTTRRRRKLLGLFHTGNMDGVLDRKFLKKGTRRAIPRPARPPEQVRARSTCCRVTTRASC